MIHSTHTEVLQGKELAHLDEQPPQEPIRRLVAQCQELARQYQTTPEITLERAWWRAFHQAGVCLRDALENARDHWHKTSLTSTEVEHAYMTLIHVAYFFEPGGIADAFFQEHGWAGADDEAERSADAGVRLASR